MEALKQIIGKQEPRILYWLDNSLYLNITNQCTNNCWFCFRNFKQGVLGFNLKLEKEPSLDEIIAELKLVLSTKRWREVVFCGFGEPTARLDILLEVTHWIKTHNSAIPIRLDTNGHGYVLNKDRDVVAEMKEAGLSKVSVSLNGYDEESYDENCRPSVDDGFKEVIKFIAKAKASGLELEVSAIRMPEVDLQKVKVIAEGLGVSFRIREYVPCFW